MSFPHWHRLPDGSERICQLFPSPERLRKRIPRCAAAPIPAAEIPDWQAWPATLPILDQNGYNGCTYYSSTQGLMFARLASAQPHRPLEPLFGYSIATGGKNVGTSILEAADQIAKQGVCAAGSMPANLMKPANIPAAAKTEAMRYRFEVDQELKSWAEVLSEAGGRRRAVIVAVQVGSSYNRLDADGVFGVDRGSGNHAILLAGGKKNTASHGPVVYHAGSWGTSWGLQGFAWYSEAHWDACNYQEAYTVRAVIEDPGDTSEPPLAP